MEGNHVYWKDDYPSRTIQIPPLRFSPRCLLSLGTCFMSLTVPPRSPMTGATQSAYPKSSQSMTSNLQPATYKEDWHGRFAQQEMYLTQRIRFSLTGVLTQAIQRKSWLRNRKAGSRSNEAVITILTRYRMR